MTPPRIGGKARMEESGPKEGGNSACHLPRVGGGGGSHLSPRKGEGITDGDLPGEGM